MYPITLALDGRMSRNNIHSYKEKRVSQDDDIMSGFANGRDSVGQQGEVNKLVLLVPRRLIPIAFTIIMLLAFGGTMTGSLADMRGSRKLMMAHQNSSVKATVLEKSGEDDDACPDVCKYEAFSAKVDELYSSFTSQFDYLLRLIVAAKQDADVASQYRKNGNDDDSAIVAQLEDIEHKLSLLLERVTVDDIASFYGYFIQRQLYGDLGVPEFIKGYDRLAPYIEMCHNIGTSWDLSCPRLPSEMDNATLHQWLLNHADNTFSSVLMHGFPVHAWSEPDGTGWLFRANEQDGQLHPVSGSGVNMSAPLSSLNDYFVYLWFQGKHVRLDSKEWRDMVETNPLYAWHMADLTPADEGTKCGNGYLSGTNTGDIDIDRLSAHYCASFSFHLCDDSTIPNDNNPGTGNYSKQHFARIWYDALLPSVWPRWSMDEEAVAPAVCCMNTFSRFRDRTTGRT